MFLHETETFSFEKGKKSVFKYLQVYPRGGRSSETLPLSVSKVFGKRSRLVCVHPVQTGQHAVSAGGFSVRADVPVSVSPQCCSWLSRVLVSVHLQLKLAGQSPLLLLMSVADDTRRRVSRDSVQFKGAQTPLIRDSASVQTEQFCLFVN